MLLSVFAETTCFPRDHSKLGQVLQSLPENIQGLLIPDCFTGQMLFLSPNQQWQSTGVIAIQWTIPPVNQ